MTARVTTDADPATSRALDDVLIGHMAADLAAANIDLDRVDLCRAALLDAHHPTGAIDRLLEDARRVARQQSGEAA